MTQTRYLTLNDPADLARLCWVALAEMLPDVEWDEWENLSEEAVEAFEADVAALSELNGDADAFAKLQGLPDASAFNKDAGTYYKMIACMVRIVIKAREIDPGARINRTTNKESTNAESKEKDGGSNPETSGATNGSAGNEESEGSESTPDEGEESDTDGGESQSGESQDASTDVES